MKVKVTKKHIQHGEPGNGETCAIAQAIKGLGVSDVSVDGDEIMFTISIKTPAAARKFITAFDSSEYGPTELDYIDAEGNIDTKAFKKAEKEHAKLQAGLKEFTLDLKLPKKLETALRSK